MIKQSYTISGVGLPCLSAASNWRCLKIEEVLRFTAYLNIYKVNFRSNMRAIRVGKEVGTGVKWTSPLSTVFKKHSPRATFK